MTARRYFFAFLTFLAGAFPKFAYGADSSVSWQTVRWTHDDVRFVGRFHAPESGHLTWVLLHGLGSGKGEWTPFAEVLAHQGDGVFVYDLRGHGESTATAKGSPVTYKEWTTAGPGSPWSLMPDDLGAAVGVLQKRYGLAAARIAVGGASLGANVALAYAASAAQVPGVMLLSPGLAYAGVGSEDAFERYGARPLFMAASVGDRYAFMSVQALARMRRDAACRVVERPGSGHGVNLFDPDFLDTLASWTRSVAKR